MQRVDGLNELLVQRELGEHGEECAAQSGGRAGHRVEQVACGTEGGCVKEKDLERSGLEEAGEVRRRVGAEKVRRHWRRLVGFGVAAGVFDASTGCAGKACRGDKANRGSRLHRPNGTRPLAARAR